MSKPWPDVHAEELLRNRVFSVRRVRRTSPRTGGEHDFWVIDPPDWVNLVALTEDGDLVLVEQWRHGTGEVTLEVPGGMVDPGEDPQTAALRELLEETGYQPHAIECIGVARPNPAIQSNRVTTYLATGCRLVQATHFDSTEDCVLRLVPMAQVAELVRAGAIDHAIVLAALGHAWLRGILPVVGGG